MVVSTSNLVETFTVRYATRGTLSRSVGQLDRKDKYGGHSAYPKPKSTEKFNTQALSAPWTVSVLETLPRRLPDFGYSKISV